MKFLLVLTAALALAAGPAHADPITAAIAWIGSTISAGLAAGGVTAFLTQMALGVGSSLLATALGALGMEKPQVKVSFEKDIGDDTPLSFVAGFYATSGKSKYIGSWGKNTRFITEVIEISSVPVAGIVDVWVNDEKATINWGAPEIQDDTGTLIGFPIKNFSEGIGTPDERDRAWIKLVDGTQTAADAFLMAVFGDDEDYPYTSSMIGKGKAYVVCTYYYDPEVMTAIPAILVQPTALPMYDLRKDSTNGGSGAHRWGNRSTYEPSENPAVIAYNIARGIYYGDEWLWGGKNLPAWRLPRAEWMAAANECDALVTLANGSTQPAYRCGAEITVDMVPADVLEEIGRASNMRYAEVGGMLKPVVGLPGAPVLSITQDDIVITEGQSYKPFYPLSETYNVLQATSPAPGEKWAAKDAPEFIDEDAMAEDGGRYLPTSISYGACPFQRQVQRLMRAQMRDFRRQRTHVFHLHPGAYGLEPLIDMIGYTDPRNGYVNKKFIVESVTKTPGMLVAVTIREVDPNDYDWSVVFEKPVINVTPVNPIPFEQTISGFTVIPVSIKDNSGADRRPGLRVSCNGDEVGVTDIRLQLRLSTATTPLLDVKRPFDEPYQWTFTELLPNTSYQVRGRLISKLTGKSVWSVWITATTPNIKLGPADVDYSTVTAEINSDLDDLVEWVNGETGSLADDILANTNGLAAQQVLINGVRATLSNTSAVSGEFASSELFDWFGVPTQWGVQQRGSNGNSSVVNSPTPYLLFMNQDATNGQARISDGIPVKPGDTLEGSMMVAGSGTGFSAIVTMPVYWHDADGVQFGPSFLVSTGTKTTIGWGEFTGQLTVPANAARATFYLRRDGGGANTAYATQIRAGRVSGAVKDLATAQSSLAALVYDTEDGVVALGEAITEVTASVGKVTAEGQFRTRVQATPTGALSRIALYATATSGEGNTRGAGLFLEAVSGDISQVIINADRFAVVNGSNRLKPFVIQGGNLILGGDAQINGDLMVNGSIKTAGIGNNQVTRIRSTSSAGGSSTGDWATVLSLTFAPNVDKSILCWVTSDVQVTAAAVTETRCEMRVRWRGATLRQWVAHRVNGDSGGNPLNPTNNSGSWMLPFSAGGTGSGTLDLDVRRQGGSTSTVALLADPVMAVAELMT